MQVMLLGMPGAGKGTQAKKIATDHAVPHVSTGDMFRAAITAGTPLGQEAKVYLDSGRLVPDELTIGIVRDRLRAADATGGFVLDGFPRTIPQAEALQVTLQDLHKPLQCALYIYVPQEALVARLTGRRICQNCGAAWHILYHPPVTPGRCNRCGGDLIQRADDTAEAVSIRFQQYQQTAPLVEWYRTRGLLHQIDGEQSVEAVHADVERVLSTLVLGLGGSW